MEILIQLGANQTAFIQFGLFIITITFLTVVVYGPFFKAYDQRVKQTKGADQVANETQDEAKKLEQIFQVRAREINEKVKTIFEDSRKQGAEAASISLGKAKDFASLSVETARKELENQKAIAQQSIKTISEEVSQEIAKKLTGATS